MQGPFCTEKDLTSAHEYFHSLKKAGKALKQIKVSQKKEGSKEIN